MKLKHYFKKIVPGLITGGADNDPSGIATYSISGAQFGFAQLWLMVLATPMLIAVQSMCARIADVTRKGLSTVLQNHFSKSISWAAALVLIVSNTVSIGADIMAVAFAFQLLTHIDLKYWILPVTIAIWYIVLFKNYKVISRYMMWLLVFFLAYAVAAVLARPDWGEVLRNLVIPHVRGFPAAYWVAAVGILGTTITPYLFFWQVKEELEDHKSKAQSLRQARREDELNTPGFIFSQCITLFIMIAAAASLHGSGVSIQSAGDAALALAPVAGRFAPAIFAIGIIGAGLLAIPVLAVSTAVVVSETAGFKHEGLSNKIKSAKGFYAVITLSLLAGVAILVLGVQPIKALYYSQVLAGILAPFLILLILIICNDKLIMGEEYTNGWFDNLFGILAMLVMATATILMFV